MSYSIAAGPGPGADRGTGHGADWENGPGGRLRVTPGRVAALALGVPIALAMIGWTAFNVVALLGQANYPVNVTIQPHGNKLTARISGDLTLRQAPVNAAQLTGTAHYSLFKPSVTVHQTATSTVVGYNCRALVGNCGLDGTLVVPENTDISVSSFGGDMSVPEFSGNGTFDTEGGTLTAGTLTGDLQLRTLGGDLNLTSLDEVGGATLQVNSSGGTVNADSVVADSASIESLGGDINLTFIRAPKSLTIHSDGGTVRLILPPGHYEYSTNPDGGSLNVPQSDPHPTSSVEVTSAGGDIDISYAKQ